MSTDSRTPASKGSGDQLRGELIAAASALLLAPQQPSVPSLRAVARACRVSPTAIYLHFASQHELIGAVIEAQLEALGAHLATANDDIPARARAYVAWGLEHPGAYQLIFESADQLGFSEGPDGPGSQLVAQNAALLTARGVAAEAAQQWALRLWVALHGLVSLRIHKPDHEWTDAAGAAADAIVALHLAAIGRA